MELRSARDMERYSKEGLRKLEVSEGVSLRTVRRPGAPLQRSSEDPKLGGPWSQSCEADRRPEPYLRKVRRVQDRDRRRDRLVKMFW
ncbi:hypothetical protein GUJ93_ZPchr0008g11681 [Zizania palustris]|uniref:Uncharacterized protein n=1 Tax=Zizania palustris TaxID=103762 RepID=A0A8J5R749_ZIZPA|nr:hypothetical protein GUJ93_ZPchr0008g11681 [Zizania palustris]